MQFCYLCGKKFDNEKVVQHEEHIIQQAIGGTLTSSSILCSSCGAILGQEIDTPFNKIFESIAIRLDIKTERKRNKTKAIRAKMRGIDVLWKDFKVTPLKPFHIYTIDKKNVIIYSSKKNVKNYIKRVEKELDEYFSKTTKPDIFICDDLEGIVEFPFEIDNQAFKKGLAKIAIGFALKCKLNREDLPLVLEIDKDSKNGKIKDNILAIPFYPLGIIDRLIEIQKSDFDPYPFHCLILFTLDRQSRSFPPKKILLCYIELFSTFQYYIVLNDEYCGKDLYRYYSQQLLKKDDYIFTPDRRHYKERNIILGSLGITEEDIEKKFNRRIDKSKSRFDIECELIQEEIIKQKYQFNFKGYLHNIISTISQQVMISRSPENFQRFKSLDTDIGKFISNTFLMKQYDIFNSDEMLLEFYNNFKLFIFEDSDGRECCNISNFRKIFYQKNSLKNYYIELIRLLPDLQKSGELKRYCHNKVYMLEDYIQKLTIKRKTQQVGSADSLTARR